jgi:hypothetical protein
MLLFVVENVGKQEIQKSLNAKNPLNPVGFVVKAEGLLKPPEAHDIIEFLFFMWQNRAK